MHLGGKMKRAFSLAGLMLVAMTLSAQWLDVPAFHGNPPGKDEKLPAILDGLNLSGPNFQNAYQSHAYVLAAKIPNVIYQQPCYCRCDRSVGHTSLHSCFESPHGAHCSTCLKELYYAYKMTKAGKKPAEIREGIIRGQWETIDLASAASIR